MSLRNLLTENSMPTGFFVATDKIELSPGGGWRITIKKGSLLQYTKNNQLYSWDGLSGDWKLRKPPISGETQFNPMQYGGGMGMINAFVKNTKAISKSQAEKLKSTFAKETVVLAKDVSKTIEKMGLKPRQKVKITIV